MLKMKRIHKDKRGEIYLITGDLKEHKELTVFTCKKSFARGGCIHKKHDEYCVVFEGEIDYYIGSCKRPVNAKKGEVIKIHKNTEHYFVAKTDCIVSEWGALPSEKKVKHAKTRKIVDEINMVPLARRK